MFFILLLRFVQPADLAPELNQSAAKACGDVSSRMRMPIAQVANPITTWRLRLAKVSERAVSVMGAAMMADRTAMPIAVPVPNVTM